MRISDKGKSQIKLNEGCRLKSYQDKKGVWTIGYGHTKGVTAGMQCTQEQAEAWFNDDIEVFADVISKHIKVHLLQHQYDALLDFAFNVGESQFKTSTLLKLVNQGDFANAAEEFSKWRYITLIKKDQDGNKVKYKVVDHGLENRRAYQRAQFTSGVYRV